MRVEIIPFLSHSMAVSVIQSRDSTEDRSCCLAPLEKEVVSVNLGLSVINEVPCLGHQDLRVSTSLTAPAPGS